MRQATVSLCLIALIVGHVFIPHYVLSRAGLPISIASGAVILLGIKLLIVFRGRRRS
jgi:hypothetical protein